MPAMAELAEIYCYPVKSLRGAQRKTAKVELIRLKGDRRFLVVDASARFQTILELPKMVQVEVETKPDGIVLRHDDAGACFVSTPRQGEAPCARCAITTRDPDTGEEIDPYEPLRTLQRFHRARNGKAMFGQYLIPDNEGTVGIA
jgi:uncharacterized protein YcbX